MQYRPYGNTGIQVSSLGFGAMRLPALQEEQRVDLEASIPILRRAFDLGVNYVDTAYGYIWGTSEVAVGLAIKGYDRSKLFLATKIPVGEEEEAKPDVWRRKLELCLARFDTPYIDFIHFHGLRWNVFEQFISKAGWTLDEARKAQSEGLVRHICFSCHDEVDNMIKLIDTGEFAGMLVQYNYLDRHNEPAIAHAHQKGMGVAIMGPVAGGRLVIPQGVVIDQEGELEIKTPELALRFVWENPNVSTALSGMNSLEMLEENVASASKLDRMAERERASVISVLERQQKLADLYCTGCAYCIPCPNDVNIPENFRYMNWFRVWGLDEQAKKAYANLNGERHWAPYGPITGLRADACLQCGECEPKCPQNIHIIDQLQEVAGTLGAKEVDA
jgi:predicted aldo/keto reductase-like oxidoreductase